MVHQEQRGYSKRNGADLWIARHCSPRIGVLPQFATLLDIQRGNALVLLFEEFREPGSNGLLEIPLDCIQKQYDSANDSGMIDGN